MTLNKKPETKGHTYCIIPLICNIQNRRIHRDRKQIRAWQGLRGGENGQALFKGFGVFTWGDERFLNYIVVIVAQHRATV